MDDLQHTLPPGVMGYYSDMSIWDIYRTQIPLLNLLLPSVAVDIMNTLVTMFKEGGDLPRWPIANVYSGCMEGTHANLLILDAWVKNVTGFDIQTAYTGN